MLRAPSTILYPDATKKKDHDIYELPTLKYYEEQGTSSSYIPPQHSAATNAAAAATGAGAGAGSDSPNENSLAPVRSLSSTISSSEGANLLTGQDDEDDFPDGGVRAYVVVIGAFLGLLGGFGILNSTGAVQAYIQTNQLADVPVSTVTWIFSIYIFLTFFGGFIVGPLFDYIGSRIPITVGTILCAVGLFGTANSTTVVQFIFSFGICVGLGTCFFFTPMLGVVSHWFLKKRAMTIGAAMAGASIGGVVYPLALRSLYPRVGFVWAMRIIAFVACSLLAVSIFLTKDRSKELRQQKKLKQGNNAEEKEITLKDVLIQIKNSIDIKLFKDRIFLSLTLAILFNELSLFLVFTYYASYAMAQGIDDSTAYILITIVSACGAPGRYLPGFFADRYGRFNVMLIALTLMNVFVFILWIPFADNLKALYAFAALYGFSCGATLSLTPVCYGQISKVEDFGKSYGTGYCLVSFALLVGLPIGGAIIGDSGSVSGYHNMTIFCGVTGIFGTVLFALCRYFIAGWKWVKV